MRGWLKTSRIFTLFCQITSPKRPKASTTKAALTSDPSLGDVLRFAHEKLTVPRQWLVGDDRSAE